MVNFILKFAIVTASAHLVSGCSADFQGGNDSNKSPFQGDAVPASTPTQTATAATANTSTATAVDTSWPDASNVRGDLKVDYGTDSASLYASAKVVYNGDNSGDDAVFTFYLQRINPAPEKIMREIIQARGEDISDVKTIPNVCRCGKASKFNFFWKHVSGRRGALHSPVYNTDQKIQGDWILSDTVSDNKWRSGELKNIPNGPGAMFLGADTENPAAFLGANPIGSGYLRTALFHPNSSAKDHVWENRDDMRIGIQCLIDTCPANERAGTSIFIQHHTSHNP